MSEAHVVALSGGKDSTALALRLAEVEPRDYLYVCTPTGDELPDMIEHWASLERLLRKPIQRVKAKYSLSELIEEWNALPNHRQRWCTRVLKIEPFQAHMLSLAREYDRVVAYVGLRADEEMREGAIYPTAHMHVRTSITVEQRFPLREWGWGVFDVLGYLRQRGVTIPKRTDCARCFWQTLAEWKALSERHPEIYDSAVQQEKRTGHTFRSPSRDTWPADLDSLRREFRSGRQLRASRRDKDNCRVCTL